MESKEFVECLFDTVRGAIANELFMRELDKIQREEAEGIRPMDSEESRSYRRMIHNLHKHREEI